MNVKIPTLLVTALLLGLAGLASALASASPQKDNFDQNRVVQVLVTVNAKGKVTAADPAHQVRPSVRRLIRTTLDKMITAPATNDRGKPVDCQFVVNLALRVEPTGNGNYRTSLSFLSSKALPAGSWYWVRVDHHQLALTNQAQNDINKSLATDPMRSAVDARNHAAMLQHQAFMKKYGAGR